MTHLFVNFLFTLFLLANFSTRADILEPNLPDEGVVSRPYNHMIDPTLDMSRFVGRVSDRSQEGDLLKVKVENDNTRFFNAGDKVEFKVMGHEKRYSCQGLVMAQESHYFTVRVSDFSPCWPKERYFPRGVVLKFHSPTLAERILEASEFRKILVEKKSSFLKNLKALNHELWTYQSVSAKVSAEYEEKILALEREKKEHLQRLLKEKEDKIQLRSAYQTKLDELDQLLRFYQIDRTEHVTDRFLSDLDSTLPVNSRPVPLKEK